MAEFNTQQAVEARRRILTSTNQQQLEAKVFELMLRGWARVGDIAVAKSVIDSEPPYFTQAMVKVRDNKRGDDDD